MRYVIIRGFDNMRLYVVIDFGKVYRWNNA
jgi:hypothetical protein